MVFLLQVDLKPFFARKLALGPVLACAGCLGLFLWICAQFYLPGKGFTYLIEFGDRAHAHYLPQLQAVNHYELSDSDGYDAQSYAQIAMQPRLSDPALQAAMDSLPYRARRILLCWTAYALAGGDPARAMHIFAVQNIFCWFALAVLLWRWLPPRNWENFIRWAGVMFSFGLCCSVRGSLMDGPSLLLIAGAAALVESGWLWLAAAVLGVACLARETNILAGLMLVAPGTVEAAARRFRGEKRRAAASTSILRLLARGAIAVAPLTLWLITLYCWIGRGSDSSAHPVALDPGARNFALPFLGYAHKWRDIFVQVRAHGFDQVTFFTVLVMVTVSVQWLFIVLRPRWSELWWRIAAPFAVLAVFLGDAVWEGYPGATTRVVLPLTVAFNVLLPARRRWLILLLIGNLSTAVLFDTLAPPGRESSVVTGPRDLRIVPVSGQIVDVSFDGHWFAPEKSWLGEYWRWCTDDGVVTFHNPHPFPVRAEVTFGLRANDDRVVGVVVPARTLWLGKLEKGKLRPVDLPDVVLPPGDTRWTFESANPPIAGGKDHPHLSFSLRNLKIALSDLKTSQSLPAAAGKAPQ